MTQVEALVKTLIEREDARDWAFVRRVPSTYTWKGLAPLTLRNGERATFASWYAEWLVDALQAPPGPLPASAAATLLAWAKRWLRRQRQAWDV